MDNIQPGQQLGAYRIVGQIGQGGMATVYKAYQAAMDRYVALKVLPGESARSPEFMGRFQQEARTIAKLEHAHILPVYDYGETNGVTYFVMRLLETGTLKERITAKPLTLSEIDAIFTQIADALGYAHQHGVIHRDIKPSNILIDKNGDTFLTDFGIAKILEEGSPQYTNTGAITGTPAYMSPEQAQGEKLDQRSDIYALGIVLYEMVTGRVPFEAETPLAVILKHLQAPLPLPSKVKPDLSLDIERVLLKALAKDRNERFATCKEFLQAWKAGYHSAAATGAISLTPTTTQAPQANPTYPLTPVSTHQGSATGWIVGGVIGVLALCLCLGIASVMGAGATIPFLSFGPSVDTPPTAKPDAAPTATFSLNNVPTLPSVPTLPAVPTVTIPSLPPDFTPTPESTGGFATQVWAIGGEGTGAGFFQDARYMGVDGEGNIYVGEHQQGSRIQVFDAQGKFVTQWQVKEDAYLTGLAADRKGIVYVLQGWKIYRYEGATGKLLGQISSNERFEAMAVTLEDEVVAVSDKAIVRFNREGQPEMKTTNLLGEMVDDQMFSPSNIGIDGAGNIYLVGTFNYAIFKFSPAGKFMDRIGSEGDNPGQFRTAPEAVAIDGQGRIYASGASAIQVFDADGGFLDVIELDAGGYAFSILFNDQNELLVLDRNGYKLIKYVVRE